MLSLAAQGLSRARVRSSCWWWRAWVCVHMGMDITFLHRVPAHDIDIDRSAVTDSMALLCAASASPRISWITPSHCPSKISDTDAIQLATNEILDAIDGIVSDGLHQAGYGLLAVLSCPALMHPSNRASIASYAFSRGLMLVSAGLDAGVMRAKALDHAIYPHGVDTVPCIARKLAEASGASGWNDPRALLSMDGATLDSPAVEPFLHRLRSLRVRFAHACMHRRPLALAPSIRPRHSGGGYGGGAGGDLPAIVERTHVLATLTNRVALALHASPLNASSTVIAQRHPVRISTGTGTGIDGVQAWVRLLREPPTAKTHLWNRLAGAGGSRARISADATDGGDGSDPVAALLVINRGRELAAARLSDETTLPFKRTQLYVLSAWGNTSAHSATGVPPGTPLTAIMGSIDVPPLDAVLYLLFSSPIAAQQFDLDGGRVRGGSVVPGDVRIGRDAAPHGSHMLLDGATDRRGQRKSSKPGGAGEHQTTESLAGWSDHSLSHGLTMLALAAAALAFCLWVRRSRLRREAGASRWDRYAHTRLSAESPSERPGTESKRKGRGRNSRPRLPSVWMPLLPAASPPAPAPPRGAAVDDEYQSCSSTPIPFNMRAMEPPARPDPADAEGHSLGTRRGFTCSASFQEFGRLESEDPRKLVPQQCGPPLIGSFVSKLRNSDAEAPSMLLPEVSMLSSCTEEECAPHRRTPRQSYEYEQHSSGTCFNV